MSMELLAALRVGGIRCRDIALAGTRFWRWVVDSCVTWSCAGAGSLCLAVAVWVGVQPASFLHAADPAQTPATTSNANDEKRAETTSPTTQDATTQSSPKPAGQDGAAAKLPMPGEQTEPFDPAADLEAMGYEDPSEKVRDMLAPPPGATKISKTSSLWIDTKKRRVYVDGYVSLRDAPLEMFACPVGTKEHESIVATLAKSSEVHAGLLAVGAQSGTTVKFQPRYVPATGQRIRVWVMYRDKAGKFHYADAKDWVRYGETTKSLEMDWVFAGSNQWTDPEDGKTYYQADSGELICVSNFGTAMMDLPIQSSDSNAALSFMAYTSRIPVELTPVRLMLVPIPVPSDKPAEKPADAPEPLEAPDESLLQLNKDAKAKKPAPAK